MILCIADIIDADLTALLCDAIQLGRLEDGRNTAGWHARGVKNNRQLGARDAAPLQASVLQALRRNETFAAAVLPRRFTPTLFSRYDPDMSYGTHVDDALMGSGDGRIRSDMSFTIFLSEPDSYDGGELVIEDAGGERSFKLPAGSAVVYPSTTLHRVEPVSSGGRLVALGWVQSLVREADRREILFDIDLARRAVFQQQGKSAMFDRLAKSYANLLRMWSDV